MARNLTAHKPGEGSKALNRLPHLANPLLRFNLSDELRQLRSEDSWQRETGRSSKTLAKYPDFRICPGSHEGQHADEGAPCRCQNLDPFAAR